MKYQLIKWVTIVLQLGLLGVLFVPFIHDYELSLSLWNIIQDGYRTGSLEDNPIPPRRTTPKTINAIFFTTF